MANWDFVFSYNSVAADWLAEQNLPHPAVRPGNRLPTTAEMMAAWRKHDTTQSLLIDDFDWNDEAYVPKDAFKLRGDLLIALRVLVELATACGQFWLYPDTGEPAIIVDSALDPAKANRLHQQSSTADNSWSVFHAKMYGT